MRDWDLRNKPVSVCLSVAVWLSNLRWYCVEMIEDFDNWFLVLRCAKDLSKTKSTSKVVVDFNLILRYGKGAETIGRLEYMYVRWIVFFVCLFFCCCVSVCVCGESCLKDEGNMCYFRSFFLTYYYLFLV